MQTKERFLMDESTEKNVLVNVSSVHVQAPRNILI